MNLRPSRKRAPFPQAPQSRHKARLPFKTANHLKGRNFNMRDNGIKKLTLAAVCLALCMVLPFLTGHIPQIGSALSPMHIPVLLGGFLCGPWWAMAVGLAAPLLRHVTLGMPPLVTAIAMSFELAAYGLFSGLLYAHLPKKTSSIYISLIAAMLLGRVVWGAAMVVISGVTGSAFTWAAFLAGAFLKAIPGIIVHILLIPVIVMALRRAGLTD